MHSDVNPWRFPCEGLGLFLILFCIVPVAHAQELSGLLADLTKPHDYVLKRAGSWDRTGGNADARKIAPGETLTVLDDSGPGVITHVWFTIASRENLSPEETGAAHVLG